MKASKLHLTLLSVATTSQLILPLRSVGQLSVLGPTDRVQAPLVDGPGPAMSPSDPATSAPAAGGLSTVMLSDVMGRDRSINIFAGLARDIESVSQRLDDATKNSTVLAPVNSAIEKLPRKPWEDDKDYGALGAEAYEGDDGQERARRNLRRFVEAHILPLSPWPAEEKVKPVGDEQEVWWEEMDGVKLIQPGNIEVSKVATSVANGEVWIIKGVRSFT